MKPISRRDFIRRSATGTAFLALTPASSLLANPTAASWSKKAKKFSFYMIGHGHIDPVWLWPWTEGVSVVHSTFRSALDRMNETPDFVFAASSAQFYHWISLNDPGMLAEIRQRVAEGRWNVVGGWWVEPDMNIPSGEAMARQGLYGQLTLQRLVGRRATTAFNPDSFGHPGALPQIIRLQGMENYVFMRPELHEKTLPADLFWWEGIDNSRVLTYRIQDGYNSGSNAESIKSHLEEIVKRTKNHPATVLMGFYGVGDHGGGPTKANIQGINKLKAGKDAPAISYGSVDRYFNEIRANKDLSIPVVKDDLQHHAVGCYTAECDIKKNNRQAEAALVTAEKITGIGSVIWKADYPKEAFTAAWQKLLFLQFHDSLAGSSVSVHSQDAREGYGHILNTAHESVALAIQKLEWQIAAEDPESQYVVLFNPHAWEIDAHIAYDLDWKPSPCVMDDRGRVYPAQWTAAQSVTGRRRILFTVPLPPMGYRQIRVMKGDSSIPSGKVAEADENRLENDYFRITFSPNGTISIFDKEAGKEVFAGGNSGCKGVVIEDTSDTWSHGIKSFSKEIGSFGGATVKVLDKGPLRATVRVVSTYGKSTLTIDWSLYSGSRRIEAAVSLDWHEQLKMVKFSFPVDVEAPVPTYEIPYGHIVREANGDEDPGQRWIDLTGKRDGGLYGLTVVNDAKYGYNVLGNDMRISVARSAPFAHHDPAKLNPEQEYIWMDQGIQTFRMLLIPHKDSWKEAHIPRIAEEFIAPPAVVYQGIHKGSMPASGSFLAIDTPNVVVSAIKKSEEGDDVIIRLVETLGEEVSATLHFPSADFSWKGRFKPSEIKTLRLNPQTGLIKEVNVLEE
ncbi:MAG: glycosyl hydrolase-related protein [Tannerellaceae bacterium]|jgi:alpha-mannosidase|nr:glycosyl hydrolase-related protein [Tannerellaceae bacterium]